MKLEIRKETRINGDMFYHLYKDDKYMTDGTTYINGDPQKALEEIEKRFEYVKHGFLNKEEIIKSEEIIVPL